jgi:hypothetical protein
MECKSGPVQTAGNSYAKVKSTVWKEHREEEIELRGGHISDVNSGRILKNYIKMHDVS